MIEFAAVAIVLTFLVFAAIALALGCVAAGHGMASRTITATASATADGMASHMSDILAAPLRVVVFDPEDLDGALADDCGCDDCNAMGSGELPKQIRPSQN